MTRAFHSRKLTSLVAFGGNPVNIGRRGTCGASFTVTGRDSLSSSCLVISRSSLNWPSLSSDTFFISPADWTSSRLLTPSRSFPN